MSSDRHYLQRDVEVQFDNVDKSGGFIGALFVPQADKTVENVAVTLVKEGLASVHDYSAETLSWNKQLYDAQVWCDQLVRLPDLTRPRTLGRSSKGAKECKLIINVDVDLELN